MSVFPGFSGQSYIEGSEDRVGKVAEMAKRLNPDLLIEVDGGISAGRTAGLVCAQGADVLVAGSGCIQGGRPRSGHLAFCAMLGRRLANGQTCLFGLGGQQLRFARRPPTLWLRIFKRESTDLLRATATPIPFTRLAARRSARLNQAREDIARSIKARPDEVTFTSGATEADNAALFGIVDAAMARAEQEGDHECVPQIVVSSIEHDAVLKAAETLGWGARNVC